MKKNKLFLFLITLVITISCSNDSDENIDSPSNILCDNEGIVIAEENFYSFNSEEQLADFQSLGYTHINGTLRVSNVSDLSSLTCLKSIDHLIITNANIANLNGLQNLESVERLIVTNCDNLVNFEGIGNVSKLDELNIRRNESLINFEGFESLTTISYLNIQYNDNLINLNGLNNLTTTFESEIIDIDTTEINSEIFISNNLELLTIDGINNINNKIDRLILYECPSLNSLGDFNQLTEFGYLSISYCSSLSIISGFDNVIDMTGLNVGENNSLESFNFPSLKRLGILNINHNLVLNSLEGFFNLEEIYGSNGDFCFQMDHNPSLTTLNGLESLAYTSKLVSINPFTENDLENTCALTLLVDNYLSVAGTNHLDNHISVYSQCGGYDFLLYNFYDICDCN